MSPPSPQPSAVSADLENELALQARDLAGRVAEGREWLARLRDLVASAEQSLAADEALLSHVQSLLPSSHQPSLETLDERLRGVRLREVALEVLASRGNPGEAVHYREWYEWLREADFVVAGQNPLATFLAQITRAPEVRRVGGARSGRYAFIGD